MADITETVTLSRSIKTHAGDTTTITLKEPLARSFVAHGEPFKVRVLSDDKGESVVDFDFNNAVLVKFLSDMSGFDDLILSSLRAVDYVKLRIRAAHLIIGLTGGTNPIEA